MGWGTPCKRLYLLKQRCGEKPPGRTGSAEKWGLLLPCHACQNERWAEREADRASKGVMSKWVAGEGKDQLLGLSLMQRINKKTPSLLDKRQKIVVVIQHLLKAQRMRKCQVNQYHSKMPLVSSSVIVKMRQNKNSDHSHTSQYHQTLKMSRLHFVNLMWFWSATRLV